MTCFSEKNDKNLVLQLQKNHVEAFDELFHKYRDKLFCFSFSLLKNREDAQEIVQEVFFRIWMRRAQIDSSKSFKSFLFTISYHLIIDQLRSRMRDKEYREHLEQFFETTNMEFNHEADFEKLQDDISRAVQELPDKRKNIYILSRQEGLSYKEIACQLDITEKTVENQINLALKHIKFRLGKEVLPVMLFLWLLG